MNSSLKFFAFAVSSRALDPERTETLTALNGFLTGWGDWK
jgi:hypothetical protein